MNFSKPRSNDDLVSDSRPLINLKHVRSQIFFNVKTDDDNDDSTEWEAEYTHDKR